MAKRDEQCPGRGPLLSHIQDHDKFPDGRCVHCGASMQEDWGTGRAIQPSRFARPQPPTPEPAKPPRRPWDDVERDPVTELRALQSDLSPEALAKLEFLRYRVEHRPHPDDAADLADV